MKRFVGDTVDNPTRAQYEVLKTLAFSSGTPLAPFEARFIDASSQSVACGWKALRGA